jgi:hypothetical protein
MLDKTRRRTGAFRTVEALATVDKPSEPPVSPSNGVAVHPPADQT